MKRPLGKEVERWCRRLVESIGGGCVVAELGVGV